MVPVIMRFWTMIFTVTSLMVPPSLSATLNSAVFRLMPVRGSRSSGRDNARNVQDGINVIHHRGTCHVQV